MQVRIFYLSFLILLVSSCSAYKEVELITVGKYTISNVTNNSIDLSVNMEVNNPNGYNIKVKKTVLDLFLENEKIGTAEVVNNLILLKKKQENYTLTIRTDYKKLSNTILAKLPLLIGKQNLKIGLKGKVKAKAYGIIGKKIPLDLEETIPVKELSKLLNF